MEADKHFKQNFDELRYDLKSFIETRLEILRVEIRSGLKRAQNAAVLFAAAAILAFVGLILLGACVALAIGLAFGAFTNQVGLVWGFLVAGAGILIVAGVAGLQGRAKLKAANLRPERTLRVLRRDQEAIKQQAAIPLRKEGGVQYGEPNRIGRRA